MSLSPGQTLAHYEILAPLGAGGMGEVHRARDTRLQREVAIKVLPDALAADEDRLRRFEREARVLASLNHPNVAQIFGVDRAGDVVFLVLELVPGESLAGRIARGPLPVEEALDVGRQIAEGLEAAHEAGVIHRDLKPANVRVTQEGVAKVLDFGLAKSIRPRTPGSGAAESDSALLTEEGVLLGTPTYMSPEQARGRPVDRRADVWAFGCVLYECLAGRRLFGGESVGEALASVLHGEPDFSPLPAATPARVRELLVRCLAKDPRQRLRDVGDARLEIERAIASREWVPAARTTGVGEAAVRSRRLGGLSAAAALLLVGAGVGGWIARRVSTPADPAPAQVFHLSLPLPAEPRFAGLIGIAPDASYVVVHASPANRPEGNLSEWFLATRWLDRGETRAIEGTEGALSAALSADGRWLAFLAEREPGTYEMTLRKVALEAGRPTGPPSTVCERVAGWATLCWASDEEIALAMAVPEARILVVPAKGGEPRVVVREAAEKEGGVRGWWYPRALPGGRAILATWIFAEGGTFRRQAEVVDLGTGARKVVLERASGAAYLPTGHLLAQREQTLVALPFDLARLEPTGGAVAVLGGAADFGVNPSFATSRTGVLAMVPRPAGGTRRRLAWIDADGRAAPVEVPSQPFGWAAISGDGRRVAYGIWDRLEGAPPNEFWVHDLERRTTNRLTTPGIFFSAVWHPDGERIAFGSGVASGAPAILERRADGTDEPRCLYALQGGRISLDPLAWTPDGRYLAFARWEVRTGREALEFWVLERGQGGAEGVATRYLTTNTREPAAAFSPDGKWICYGSIESGRQELHVQRFGGPESGAEDAKAGRWRISTGGGGSPWWSADGGEIRYLDDEGRVMSVAVRTEPSFSASAPRPFVAPKDGRITGAPTFAADGRMMVVLEGEGGDVTRIDVVLGFFEVLRAKAPATLR